MRHAGNPPDSRIHAAQAIHGARFCNRISRPGWINQSSLPMAS
ncbi:hypothetical protein Agau_L400003 [Agrobacterium tumefaciens F2]|nr:hypothetical protein Agau_L400003 [Agrobacterium tumefaciens F2]